MFFLRNYDLKQYQAIRSFVTYFTFSYFDKQVEEKDCINQPVKTLEWLSRRGLRRGLALVENL